MSADREPTAGRLGLLGVGMAVCCGLPILLGAGVAVGAAGLALGSGVAVTAGVVLALWGWRRRQRRECEVRTHRAHAPGVRAADQPGGTSAPTD